MTPIWCLFALSSSLTYVHFMHFGASLGENTFRPLIVAAVIERGPSIIEHSIPKVQFPAPFSDSI